MANHLHKNNVVFWNTNHLHKVLSEGILLYETRKLKAREIDRLEKENDFLMCDACEW